MQPLPDGFPLITKGCLNVKGPEAFCRLSPSVAKASMGSLQH
jgi:hypothetical protein